MHRLGFLATLLFCGTAVAAPDRPLVFIPGIVGSELTKNSEKLWGGIWSLNNIRSLTITNGPRIPDDGVQATGVIKQISILGLITVEDYARTLFPILNSLGYREEDGTLFIFSYDWRASNFDNAKKLKEFLDNPSLKGKQVDIAAHSMGGLVAQIYLKQLSGGSRIKRLINMAVPFRGSVNTLRTLTDGWGTVENGLAGGLPVIRKFLLSLPSFYELLPEYRYCCILGKATDPLRKPYNPLDDTGWGEIRWLEDTSGISPDGVHEALRRARELRELAKQPYPGSTRVYYISGAGIDTAKQYYVDPGTKAIQMFMKSDQMYQGDGVVVEESSSNGDISQAFASFSEHQTIFNDKSAESALRRILCRECGVLNNYGFSNASAYMLDGKTLSVASVGVNTSQTYVKKGGIVTSALRIRGEGASPDKVDVTLQITRTREGGDQVVREVPVRGTLESPSVGLYSAEIRDTDIAGTIRLKYVIKGMASFSDYIVVIPDEDQK